MYPKQSWNNKRKKRFLISYSFKLFSSSFSCVFPLSQSTWLNVLRFLMFHCHLDKNTTHLKSSSWIFAAFCCSLLSFSRSINQIIILLIKKKWQILKTVLFSSWWQNETSVCRALFWRRWFLCLPTNLEIDELLVIKVKTSSGCHLFARGMLLCQQ